MTKEIYDIIKTMRKIIETLCFHYNISVVPALVISFNIDVPARYLNRPPTITFNISDLSYAIAGGNDEWILRTLKHEIGHHFANYELSVTDESRNEKIAKVFEDVRPEVISDYEDVIHALAKKIGYSYVSPEKLMQAIVNVITRGYYDKMV